MKSTSVQRFALHATTLLKLQVESKLNAQFNQVDNKNQSRITNWQNRCSTLILIKPSETGTESPGKQSGINSKRMVSETPSTPTSSTAPILSSHTSNTQALFYQIRACPVYFDNGHRLLDCHLIQDRQNQKISHFKKLYLHKAIEPTSLA